MEFSRRPIDNTVSTIFYNLADGFINGNDIGEWFNKNPSDFCPKANTIIDPKNHIIEVALPFVKKEDVDVSYDKNVLTVKGKRTSRHKSSEDTYVNEETNFGSFSRSWKIENVDFQKMTAKFSDGVLVLTLPRTSHKNKVEIN